MKRLLALVVCAGMMWGCGKKSPVGLASNPNSPVLGLIQLTLVRGMWLDSTNHAAHVLLGASRIQNIPCHTDSLKINNPAFSLWEFFWGDTIPYDTMKVVQECVNYNSDSTVAWPPPHGQYSIIGWGHNGSTVYQSNTLTWTW